MGDLASVLYVDAAGHTRFRDSPPLRRAGTGHRNAWIPLNFFNNVIGNAPNVSVELLEFALDLFRRRLVFWVGIDPSGTAWNLLAQGRTDLAIEMFSFRGPYPFPPNHEGWTALYRDAQSSLDQINDAVRAVRTRVGEVAAASQTGTEEIQYHKQQLETAAKQANLLVSSVNTGAANAHFKEDATRHSGESLTAWKWGLGTLVLAAVAAILPLVLHYAGVGPDFSSTSVLVAHATSTAALAAVAGVLLARARSRDRAAQRASDLATAMGTVITYSNQIPDPTEKQRFMLTMGQLVLQAQLQSESGGKDEAWSGVVSLLSAMRSSSVN